MSPKFKETAKASIEEFQRNGGNAVEALRALEIKCGKANEEFRPEGQRLIEEIYGGHFHDTWTGLAFAASPRVEGNDVVFSPVVTEEKTEPKTRAQIRAEKKAAKAAAKLAAELEV